MRTRASRYTCPIVTNHGVKNSANIASINQLTKILSLELAAARDVLWDGLLSSVSSLLCSFHLSWWCYLLALTIK